MNEQSTTGLDVHEVPQLELANARFPSKCRFAVIVIAAVLAFGLPPWPHPWIVAALIAYAAYAAMDLRRERSDSSAQWFRLAHWIDAAFCCMLVVAGGGLRSNLEVLLLFPVLVASSSSGMRSAMAVALVCAVTLIGSEFVRSSEIDQHSLVSVALLLLVAFAIARWRQTEVTLSRRLAIEADLSRLLRAHSGLDNALRQFAEILLGYVGADSCAVVISHPEPRGWLLYEAHSDTGDTAIPARKIEWGLAQTLLESCPPENMAMYRARRWPSRGTVYTEYDSASLEPHAADEPRAAAAASLLGTKCFISLPLRIHEQTIGRVLLASHSLSYRRSDVTFLTHILGQAAAIVQNIQLMDLVAKEIATDERKRISRDLHDSTIQPYVGLKLGLEALQRKCSPDDALGHEIDDLLKMTQDNIVELRSYLGRLNGRDERPRQRSLLPSVRSQAEKFSAFYGIDVQVVGERDVRVNSVVFDEIMHVIREGLYNVKRHTSAAKVTIGLRILEDRLMLEIANDRGMRSSGPPRFSPRSIVERVSELGGRVSVQEREVGRTAVIVELPV